MSSRKPEVVVENPLLVDFRSQLLKRGASSIKGIGLYFREIDDDRSRLVNFAEFKKGVLNHNISMKVDDLTRLFGMFDRNGDGNISFDEFLVAVRVSFMRVIAILVS
jgi:hypothetical protein